MGNSTLIRTVLSVALIVLIGSFKPIKTEARETYIEQYLIDLCDQYGQEYNINTYLLVAIIEAESSGNPNVVSANGQYIGLMQLNKDTFTGDLTDPANNIQQGAAYIDKLRDWHGCNALEAYSYFCGESGRCGFYTQKVVNKFFELFCSYYMGQPERRI